jgi:chorismate mutase-like protein
VPIYSGALRGVVFVDLGGFREKIDAVDKSLLKGIAKRMRVSSQIGSFKKKKGLALRDSKREAQLISDRSALARRLGLNPAFTERLFREILRESLRVQKKSPSKK